MRPGDLKPDDFKRYPPQARALAADQVHVLRRLPLSYLPSLLRELINFDFKFPAERRTLEKELSVLRALPQQQFTTWFAGFEPISVSAELERLDWVNSPAQFV